MVGGAIWNGLTQSPSHCQDFLPALYYTDLRDECRALASIQITIVSFEIIDRKKGGWGQTSSARHPVMLSDIWGFRKHV